MTWNTSLQALLTSCQSLDMVLCKSHRYPPGYYSAELYASSAYQTPLLHKYQDTTSTFSNPFFLVSFNSHVEHLMNIKAIQFISKVLLCC
jgi:hypothetical protein